MARVPERAEQVRHAWDADAVHDLRVALRRCRTMSDALSKVNPGPGWRKLKKTTRELFHDLGDLRDTQVERSWMKKLGPAGDPVRKHMLRLLSREEQTHRKAAEQALDHFDRKDWRKLTRKLASKARFFPLESVVFQRLALESLHEAVSLYQQARKRRSSIAWHHLRIEIKNFRYIVENFLPHRYEVWADDLKRMQDLLGRRPRLGRPENQNPAERFQAQSGKCSCVARQNRRRAQISPRRISLQGLEPKFPLGRLARRIPMGP